MISPVKRFLQGSLVAALFAGCSNSGTQENSALNRPDAAADSALVSSEPCATVLVPLAESDLATARSEDRSIARYQRALPGTSQPLYMLERLGWAFVTKARESRDAGYYTLAEQTAACIDSTAPDSPEALLLRGHVLHNLHRFSEAEALARRLVERRGSWFDFALLGDVLMERGALGEAVDAYQAVLDQRPGPQAYVRVAQLRWLKGDMDGAVEMMVTAVRATSSRLPEASAWAHVRLARLLMQLNRLPAADAVLERALSLQSGYPPALHLRGRLWMAQGRTPEALTQLERAVRADPLPEFRWTLYEALRIAGRVDAAGDQKSALLQRGEVEDRRTFALFLATVGDDPQTALRLASRELQQREDVFTLDAVAWALSGTGRNDEAFDFIRRALAEGTQDARLFFHAGVIAARVGDKLHALEWLGKAESIQQMLLPSERQRLTEEFAALQPRVPTLVNAYPPHRERLTF